MPRLRSDRAPRACEHCRRLKTRCYPSKYRNGSCLRCETHHQECSLGDSSRLEALNRNQYADRDERSIGVSTSTAGIEERLAQIETVVQTLVDRLDVSIHRQSLSEVSRQSSLIRTQSPSIVAEQDAPVLLIKGIAEDSLIRERVHSDVPKENGDLISDGIVRIEAAYELLLLFRLHYGRWVNFDEDISIDQLMAHVRTSPLLFCSICLVAARHTTHQPTNALAPTFFREAKRLLQSSLLTIPQTVEFFQAALLLSLWSTTIGQIPLSIDGWLLTSYTLQQGIASSMVTSAQDIPDNSPRIRNCCTWNHICLAHLQYCVGTGRRPLLQASQIDRCAAVLDHDVSQFERRMVAELKLYWIIVSYCCAPSINLSTIRTALYTWKKRWHFLFDQPRSQFLEMGYNFALLLAHCRLLHSPKTKLSRNKLEEMVERARSIITLARRHTDERTPHVTDHIYHIITFSAITLCRLITRYQDVLGGSSAVAPLRDVILGLVDWLRSIGLASHISHVLANTIAAHYAKCTAQEDVNVPFPHDVGNVENPSMSQMSSMRTTTVAEPQALSDFPLIEFPFQDHAWTTFFDFNADDIAWPQGSDVTGDDVTPSNTSWTASADAISP